MKKLFMIVTIFTLMISGCLTYAPISPDEELPWYGLTDPTQKSRSR